MFIKSKRLLLTSLLAVVSGLSACGDDSPDKKLESARGYQARDEQAAAIVQLKSVLQQQPDSAPARFLLGRSLLATGDSVAAAVEFRKALERGRPASEVVPWLAKSLLQSRQFQPLIDQFGSTRLDVPEADADLKVSISTAYLELKNKTKAAAAIAEAQRVAPAYPGILLAQVRLASEEGRVADALSFAEKAIAAAPNDAVAWHYKGEVLLSGKKDLPGAAQAYRKALELQASYLPARSNLLSVLLAQGDSAAAAEQLAELKKLAPGAVQTVFFDAKLAFLNGDTKKAHEIVQQLVKLAPDSFQILVLAGGVAANAGSLLDAERHLSKALLMRPDSLDLRQQLARVHLRSGKPLKAVDVLAPTTSDQPSAQTYATLGEAYVQLGNPKSAEANFAKAAQLNPADSRSRVGFALARMESSGNSDSALEQLNAVASESKAASPELALATVHIRRKEYDKALAALDRAEAKQPNRALTSLVRGRVFLVQGKAENARKEFERALARNAAYLPAVFALADLDVRERKPEAAQERFKKVLAIDAANLGALMGLALAKEGAGAPRDEVVTLFGNAIRRQPGAAAPRLALIERHFKAGDFKAALTAAQEADTAVPNNADVIDALGRAQAAVGEANRAIVSFNRMGNLQADSPKAALRIAAVQLASKNWAAAEPSFRRALAISPTLIVAQQGLIHCLLESGRPRDAMVVAKRVQSQRPKEAVGYMLEGNIERFQGSLPAAEAAYRKAFAIEPTTTTAQAVYSVLTHSNKVAVADAFSQAWLDKHSNDFEFLGFVAESTMGRGQFEAAQKIFMQLLAENPQNALVLNNLSWLKMQLKQPGALADAERANNLVPNSPPFLDTLAQALAADNKVDKALEVQKRALSLAPSDPLLKLSLAKLYIQAGNKEAARTELQALAKEGKRFGHQSEVQRMLQAL